MAKATLPTNYQDDVLKSTMGGKRRYTFTDNSDGTKCLEDATQYEKVGSNFGAADINKTNAAVNAAADASKIIDNVDDIAANTQAGDMMGALAGKQLIQNLNGFAFKEEKGVKYVRGADSVWVPLGSALFGEIILPSSANVAVSYELGFRPSKLCIMSNSETYSSSVVWRYEATRGFTEQYSYNSFDGSSYTKNKWLTITDTGFTITLSGSLHKGEQARYFALR